MNPLQTSRYRERHGVSRAYSDGADSRMLADMVRIDSRQLRPVARDSPRWRDQGGGPDAQDANLGPDRQVQRLRYQLREYFPCRWRRSRTWTPDAMEPMGKAPEPAPAARLTWARSPLNCAVSSGGRLCGW